jgi:transposase
MRGSDPRDELIKQQGELLSRALDRIQALERRVAELEADLRRNSTNSSKPPSTDPPGVTRSDKEPSGRRAGGQPGHKKNERRLLEPDRVLDIKPVRCRCCGKLLRGSDPLARRHQVIELPNIKPEVTDYLLHSLCCAGCGERTAAVLPAGVPRRGFGPVLTSAVALLTGKFHLSKRLVVDLLNDVLGIPISAGSICNLEQEMSAALAVPTAQAHAFVKRQPFVYADETGWGEGRAEGRSGKYWLWSAVTPAVSIFTIEKGRGRQEAERLLSPAFRGWLVTDRWCGYNWYPLERRQICWAHLKRDFKSWVEWGKDARPLGLRLLLCVRRLFRAWNAVRDKQLGWLRFVRRMRRLESEVVGLLRKAKVCSLRRVAWMASDMLRMRPSLFAFARRKGLEPTNNAAERRLRPAVMWRKTSFGTQGPAGSRFAERILTATSSLKQQGRDVLDYLCRAFQAWLENRRAPKLLPAASAR